MPLDMFGKTPVADTLPSEMQETINKLKESKNKEDCLKHSYEILIKKYKGHRVQTYAKLFGIFSNDIVKFWDKQGFLHCTNINYVMRTLLVRSGFFTDDEIKIKWTLVWYTSPHQYLQIKIDNSDINIDIWSYAYGIKYNDYAYGFH